ncbi:MAG: alkyl sulfatase dimerization domain-containing protein, partial [Thermodesulfobacteriota bacterium]
PASLRNYWSNRGYYGTLKHNSKAVYQAYFGWYDGNPANLDPLPPENSATRYIAYMGGADRVLEKAQASFDDGDYRWVAEVLNHLVFAEPDNSEAKALLARTYDQLGYQAESGVWRNVYLTGAYELRHGAPDRGVDIASMYEVLKQTPLSRLFDSMAVRLDGPAAEGKRFVVNVIFTDINESYVLTLENSVLHHRQTDPAPDANATLKLTHELFLKMAIGKAGIRDTVFSDDLETSGSRIDLVRFFLLFDKPGGIFNIVTP